MNESRRALIEANYNKGAQILALEAKLKIAVEALKEAAMQKSDLPVFEHARKALKKIATATSAGANEES